MPNARMNALRADAFGTDAAAAFTRMAERGAKMAEDMEDAHTLELYNSLKRDISQYHNDPGKGVLNRVGKDADGLYKESWTWMENKAEEYARKAKSPRAVQNFRRLAGQAIMGQGEQNSQYEGKQIRAYREAEADATISTALDDAVRNWQDDKAAGEALETAMQALELKTRGWGDEAKKAAAIEMESSFAAGRLSAMIGADPMKAEAWYKANKDRFKGSAQVKAEALLEKETKAVKLEGIHDGLLKRHGMNYAAARKEVMEKYQGDEERQVWSLYEAAYSDQKRIEAEAERRADDNFLQKLQSFGTEAEATKYLLKNAKNMNRWEKGKSYINWLFNGRRETKEGALLQFEDDLDKGKFDALTAAQAKEKLGPGFSMSDWKEIVEPALKERRAEVKTNGQNVRSVAGKEINKQRDLAKQRLGVAGAELVERQYREWTKTHGTASSQEHIDFWKESIGKRVLEGGWRGGDSFGAVTINEAKARDREARGYYYDIKTNKWINEKTGEMLEE